jgi:hypothetical protein
MAALELGRGPCEEDFGAAACQAIEAILGSSLDDCLLGSGRYVSTNKANPGDGDINLLACDRGEPGPTAGDSIVVDPTSGPYTTYENAGGTTQGNLQSH